MMYGERVIQRNLAFTVQRGDIFVIMGGSGCGKSTLLRHIIGVMKPDAGSVKIFGDEITTMNDREIADVRRRFGMLFQSGALLASLTVGENVALPLLQHTDMSAEEVNHRCMVLEAILSIQAGDNPRVLAEKLESFVPPAERGKENASPDAGGGCD